MNLSVYADQVAVSKHQRIRVAVSRNVLHLDELVARNAFAARWIVGTTTALSSDLSFAGGSP